MEMLIVIAIIAILIAIAIPIFTTQLARANAETDASNIRAGYASVQSAIMLDHVTDATFTLAADGTVYSTDAKNGSAAVSASDTTVFKGSGTAYETKGNSADTGDSNFTIGGVAGVTWTAGQSVTYTVTGSAIASIQGVTS